MDECIKKMGKKNTHTMNYYSAIKKEILPFFITRMGLESTMLSEISQTEKDRDHMISCMYRTLKKRKQNELIDTESRLVITRGGELGMVKMDGGGQKVQTSSK